MTQLRGAEIDRFLAKPNKPVVLFFGTDPGSVTERAAAVARALVGDDEMSVIRLDEADLSDASRLADEVYGGSLFTGRRVIRVRPGASRSAAASVEAILSDPPPETWVVIEAGDLRKTAPLRKLCESSANAAAIGCYPGQRRFAGPAHRRRSCRGRRHDRTRCARNLDRSCSAPTAPPAETKSASYASTRNRPAPSPRRTSLP